MEDLKYRVRVSCMTYNHASYIEDAMNGFCMQETTFPFVCTIVDDASTDSEQEVIRNYLQEYFDLEDKTVVRNKETDDYFLTFAQHKTNKNCFFAVLFLKYNHFSIKKPKKPYIEEWCNTNYVALCEGDDYWVHPLKLQKQVEFLESHFGHTGCIHAYRRDEYVGNEVVSRDVYKYSSDVEIVPDKDVLNGIGMFGATASMVYRASAVMDYPDWAKRAPVGDRPLKLVLFARGHIAYINDIMSVYRVGVPGSWTVRVNRNHKADKQSRQGFVQLMVDYDEWTEKKHHVLITKAIKDFKKACRKNDFMIIILKPYRQMKRLFKKK